MTIKKLFIGALLGGVIVYAWGFISWVVLPWHTQGFAKFIDETAITQSFLTNAPEAGIYLLPNVHRSVGGLTKEEQEAARTESKERMKQGPFAFVVIQPEGSDPGDASLYLRSLAIQVAAALLIMALLLQARISSYGQRVGFVALVGLTAGILTHLPYWSWWGFGAEYTVMQMADLTIGWTLAGLAMAKLT